MEHASEQMQERDADLGYIRMYAQQIHAFLAAGGTLSDRASRSVHDAHTHIMDAYAADAKRISAASATTDPRET